jgi:hypothetical protein
MPRRSPRVCSMGARLKSSHGPSDGSIRLTRAHPPFGGIRDYPGLAIDALRQMSTSAEIQIRFNSLR